ncbi:TPA: hypothetical protein L5694_006566 [Pseudomonas aeruginosa]|nr:hypothetical protein [Pseudomonas aeruginosa]HBP5351225.1 hypothetical protein [Pseudomonas aeruginosa]
MPFRSLERGWRRGATRSSYRGRDQAGATDVILDIKRLLLSPGNTSILPENIVGQSLSVGFRPLPQTTPITLSDGITPSRLPTLLALSWQEEPDVELRLFEVSLSQQIKGLHGDLYDLGPSLVKWVTTSWLRRFGAPPLMVAAPAWHPLLKHKRISLDEVLRYPLVLVTHMHTGVMNVRSNECCRG